MHCCWTAIPYWVPYSSSTASYCLQLLLKACLLSLRIPLPHSASWKMVAFLLLRLNWTFGVGREWSHAQPGYASLMPHWWARVIFESDHPSWTPLHLLPRSFGQMCPLAAKATSNSKCLPLRFSPPSFSASVSVLLTMKSDLANSRATSHRSLLSNLQKSLLSCTEHQWCQDSRSLRSDCCA